MEQSEAPPVLVVADTQPDFVRHRKVFYAPQVLAKEECSLRAGAIDGE